VLVNLSADWYTFCKEMDRYAFSDPHVRTAQTDSRVAAGAGGANSHWLNFFAIFW
jgi:thiol:disulfide interchange protein